ncbi:MAG: hypothetical protein EKK37_17265 [Sphingobacteriales bacterium]|nr:MAG: hypothetical protein EKK37_17265 [Sphingobacteriales bacterium]
MKTMMLITIFFTALILFSLSSFAGRLLMPAAVTDTLLPRIKFFSVKPLSTKNIISWQADNDLTAVYYEVQRSADSTDFSTVAMIPGPKPTSNNQHFYFGYADHYFKQKTKVYYRVKQVNTAGEIYYTGVIKSVNPD